MQASPESTHALLEMLLQARMPFDVDITADGKRVAFSVIESVPGEQKHRMRIWIADTAGGEARSSQRLALGFEKHRVIIADQRARKSDRRLRDRCGGQTLQRLLQRAGAELAAALQPPGTSGWAQRRSRYERGGRR